VKKQARLFGVETLPLFSGTAQRGGVGVFDPHPAVTQETFVTCRFCRDTGRVGEGFCWCAAGQRARARQSKK
jgi:hypothetical protein